MKSHRGYLLTVEQNDGSVCVTVHRMNVCIFEHNGTSVNAGLLRAARAIEKHEAEKAKERS
jgi:hypothetical protein